MINHYKKCTDLQKFNIDLKSRQINGKPCFWIEKQDTKSMVFPYKLVTRGNEIPIKYPKENI